jgi:glutamyl-tRNA(Gln) amidotransferase subunit D
MDTAGGRRGFVQSSRYRIIMRDGDIHQGVFVFEDDAFIYLKLESGYNIGISKAGIETSAELPQDRVRVEPKKSEVENDVELIREIKRSKPEILVLHTGGTIASRVDYSTGAVSAKFTTDDLLTLFPELEDIAEIESEFVSNMLSENLNFSHYNRMASAIAEALKNKALAGIILAHGTDTLHYTAAALSFMFENLRIPVVLVGAQRSSDRPSSDAALNILSAALFISKSAEHNFGGVFICMHEGSSDDSCLILPGVNVRKMHSSRRDAFRAVNSSPFARVCAEKGTVDILRNSTARNETEGMGISGKKNKGSESTPKLFIK